MNNDPSATNPPYESVMVMEVEDGSAPGRDSSQDIVKHATPKWVRRFPMCVQRLLFTAFCMLVGLIATFLIGPFLLLYYLLDGPQLAQTYIVQYQQDGTVVEADVTEQCRETIHVVHIQKEGFLVTVEYQDEDSSQQLEQGDHTNKWRKKFRFPTLEQIESAMTQGNDEGPRMMKLCYPLGQPQAALPLNSVHKAVEHIGTQTSTTKGCLKGIAFMFGTPFYFMLLFSGFDIDQLVTGRFWVICVLWAAISLLVALVLYFAFGLSPMQLHQKLVCKSAERIGGETTWDEEHHNNSISSSSLTAPLLSAVTGF